MNLVLDVSLAASWFFIDEQTERKLELLRTIAVTGAIVPTHFKLELANVLWVSVQRRRMSSEDRDMSLSDIAALPLEIDPETNVHAFGATLSLAVRRELSVYDAAYLELAQRRRLPLATLDEKLAAAARREGVEVIP